LDAVDSALETGKTLARGSASSKTRGSSDTIPAAPNSLINRRVGNFVVERLLGQGAMGSVYLGVHDTLRRSVAIKVLQPHLAQSEDLVERFVDEAKIVSSLGHPGIAQIFDFGRLDDGQLYATMEFLDGKDLEDALNRKGAMSAGRAASICVQVAAALAVVHDRDIVHRDLKPANLFLAIDGEGQERVKVLDFGIAKLDQRCGEKRRTAAGHVVGTPEYMAPEQATADGQVSGRTDIYSLGCVLYELLCGDPPFLADSIIGILMAHAQDVPVDIGTRVTNLPDGMAHVVMRCLEKDPEKRWQNARELKAALLPYASELPDGVASVVQTGATLAVPPRDRRLWFALAGLAVLVFISLGIAATRSGKNASHGVSMKSTPTPAHVASTEIPAAKPDSIDVAPKRNPYSKADEEAVAMGAAIYASKCAGCHGADGEGNGAAAPKDAMPKDFANMRVPEGMLDLYRFGVVRRGVDGQMPNFESKLSESETWKVVTFLSTLSSGQGANTEQDLWSIKAPRLSKKMTRDGRRLFKRECTSCHGTFGRGNGPVSDYLGRKPANLVAGVYKLRTTDRDSLPTSEDLYRTISQGMGVTGMPSFSKLSAKNRWQLVAYLRSLSPKFEDKSNSEVLKIPNPPDFDAAAVHRGRATFLAAGCSKCHGLEGLGDGPMARKLKTDRGDSIAPANFSASATFVGGDSPREIYRTMMTGIAGTPMPAGDDFFDEGEAWDVIAFILSLQTQR